MFERKTLLLILIIPIIGCGGGLEPPAAETGGPKLEAPSRQDEFLSVTQTYGQLVVREGYFEAEALVKPWSSWWFPIRDTYLFQSQGDQFSPLEKYDAYALKAHDAGSRAAAFEKEKLYDPMATGWEGLCDAWAVASLMVPEPVKPVTRRGIRFGVGDQKALLVKTFEEFDGLKKFGQRYNGDRISNYDDVYPDQFHRIVQAELMEKQRPIIIDKDPGVAVWNTPIWQVQSRITSDPENPNVLHVTTWMSGASPFVPDYDFVGTLRVAFEYTYDLYGTKDGQSFHVLYGVWTGNSLDYHPDFVTVISDQGVRHSKNAELNSDWVDEIVKK